ncbi:unnamed protein product [Linum tenue]|uniref:Uncharacterized protein n=1 Tax=Linum tenue TaxID=586396 RepID=A0AAV0HTR2_9ROSI|nr:unnamed protein product [Linum tenue]
MAIDGEDNLAAGGGMQLMATATATTTTQVAMAFDGEENPAAACNRQQRQQLRRRWPSTEKTTQRRQRLHVFGYEIGAGGGNGKGSVGCALRGTASMESQRNRGPREDSGGVERRRP